jgi:hypothetical protein
MAYNVVKGIVEGSVDQHGDQEIGGVKVFKNTISASVFWDTDAQSPCATMKDVAIKEIKGNVNNGLIISDKEHGARTHHNLTYNADKETLQVNTISAKTFVGSGICLQDIPADKFADKINANFVNHGLGLQNLRGTLQIKTNNGLTLDEDGIALNLSAHPGLSINSNKLAVDPTKLEPINTAGQNASDNDLLILADISRGTTTHTSLGNLYSSYINLKVPHAVGNTGQIQIKGKTEFASSAALTFDSANNTLDVAGKTVSETLVSKNKTLNQGAVYYNITQVSEKSYDVNSTDYTLICDARHNHINVKLPPAQNNTGRVIVVKKSDSDKFKITANKVSITCEESRIDLTDRTEMKMNYSSRTFQSDGENWHIIGTKGS